mgnify:CR=1 FL=1
MFLLMMIMGVRGYVTLGATDDTAWGAASLAAGPPSLSLVELHADKKARLATVMRAKVFLDMVFWNRKWWKTNRGGF